MEKMSFKENLQRKLELEKLAGQVIASIGTEQAQHPVDKEAMRRLLELSPYQHRQERDLDLYVSEGEAEQKKILVLDNELPIFCTSVKDVTTRRSPRTLEMWKISTIRHILDDSDIKMSTREESVETVLRDALAQFDFSYTEADIDDLARDGMAWLAGGEAAGVEKTLGLFAALLGYEKPPEYFGLDQTISYGMAATGPDNEIVFGPLVLYRPADNNLAWLDKSFSRYDRQQMEFLRAVVAGDAMAPVTGDAVFQKLQAKVLEQPEPVRARLQKG